MNSHCINSLLDSESFSMFGSIFIVETNTNATFAYHPAVKIIKPNLPFNFNRFLKIGINSSDSEFVALCNNDLIFNKGWFSEIKKVKLQNREIRSFAPIDYDYWGTTTERYPDTSSFYLGYNIRTEIPGWCIVVERNLIKEIGLFDEQFDFYYSDNDYSMVLYKNQIKHALCTKSHVKHLGSKNTTEVHINKNNSRKMIEAEGGKKLPKCLQSPSNAWIYENPKMMEGYMKFHFKWGSEASIRFRKNLLSKFKIMEKTWYRLLFSDPLNYLFSLQIRSWHLK